MARHLTRSTPFPSRRLHTAPRETPWTALPAALLAVLLAVLLTVLLTAGPAAAPARAQEAERHGIFLDTIDVNLINVEVMVFDKEGEPVTGLTRGDFEVYEDGEPIEITNFFAVENGFRLLGDMPESPGETLSPAAGETPRPPEQQRSVVLYVDNGNILAPHRKRIFNEVYELLDRMIRSADRVMVVSQDQEVTIEQPFTSDRVLLESAIRRLELETGSGNLRSAQPRMIQRGIEQGEAPPGGDALVVGTRPGSGGPFDRPTWDVDARRTFGEVRSHAQLTESETRRTMEALRRFIDSLAGLPGRKAVVYVSDGLELKPGEYLFRIWDAKYATVASETVGVASVETEISKYALDSEFRDLVADANANRVTFYTVQGGDATSFGVSAETRSLIADTLARSSDGERQDSLRVLASATGGVPLLNQASLGNLMSQLESDLSTYYSLGYPSPHRGDGKYHRIRVEVKREGARLRYLEGYRDKSSDDRMTDQTLASLLLDVGENPLGIQIEVGEAERGEAPGDVEEEAGKTAKKASKKKGRGGGKGYLVPVLVRVPLAKLVLLPQEDQHLGRVSIFVAVRDSQGRLSEPQKIEMPVRIPNDKLLEALSQSAGWATRLRMRPGEQKIAIGVRDELGAVASTINLNVDVGG
jgi:VWFA-related protein